MKFEDWTAKAIELRILEMADTLRLSPKVKGPQEYGSSQPEVVREAGEGYGYSAAWYKPRASGAALGRMEAVWSWINALPDQDDRKLIYAWSWVKVRKGMKLSAFAAENDMNDRMLRREITRLCQVIANNLNQNHLVRLNSEDLQVSENQPDIATTKVTSESCDREPRHWIAPGAKPQIDPAMATTRVLDHRAIRAR